MRYFLRRHIPQPERVLLVESGSRWILEKAWERMRAIFPGARYDLCTCFPGEPAPGGCQRVFRVTEAGGLTGKLRMLLAMRRAAAPIAALLFTTEPILRTWKLALLLLLPSKLLIVNENADFFWLDRSNLGVIRQFMAVRAGVGGAEFLRSAFRIAVFPFVLIFLAISALCAYAVRWTRLLVWSLSRRL
jgi:hypothetical protein